MKPHLNLPFQTLILAISISISISIGLLISSCEKRSTNTIDPNQQEKLDSDTIRTTGKEKVAPKLEITYKIDSLNTKVELDSFKNQYSEADRKIIYALNRIESSRVRVGTNLVVPDTLIADLLIYSPFPSKLELINDIPKTVLISQRIQGFALYEDGNLVKWGPISSGKKSTPTPNGLNYGNYKAKEKISTVNDDWILPYYFNFMNFEGVGVHQYLLPGYPASHACVRLYMEDAQYIYDWATQWELTANKRQVHKNGTPFMVYGDYNYEDIAPWLQLANDNKSNNMLASELKTLEKFKEDYLKDEKNVRDFREKEQADLRLAMNIK